MTTTTPPQSRSLRRLRPLVAAAVIFGSAFLMGPSAHAQVIIDVEADTYVQVTQSGNGHSDMNFGSETFLRATNDGGSLGGSKGDDAWSIFRFDISSLTPGSLADIVLKLEQTSNDSGINFTMYGIADLGADENFNELTYTFNNSAYKPITNEGANTDGGLLKTNLTNLGSFSTTGAQLVDFSSAALDSFINADTNGIATFILFQSTSNNRTARTFVSREALTGQAPQLTVIPEPSTGIALCVGLGFLGIFRRRQVG